MDLSCNAPVEPPRLVGSNLPNEWVSVQTTGDSGDIYGRTECVSGFFLVFFVVSPYVSRTSSTGKFSSRTNG